ncbi:YbaK family protein [Bacillus sp. SM2101]|uniref:YbaK family protein n=1 Tax=Bacillaceae TaxID=186817 RepID=UPI001BDDEC9A|nr:YbaK family protein [Bacillus sp. SM2101]
MNVITTFAAKQKEKQVIYERKMLRELSLEIIKKQVEQTFSDFYKLGVVAISAIEDGCVDVAVESYLLGASYSRFGYFGEPLEKVKLRCITEEKYLINTLYDYVIYWGNVDDFSLMNESMYYTCEHFVSYWFNEGFYKGEKRYRMKLH